jgi:hypothetical protein
MPSSQPFSNAQLQMTCPTCAGRLSATRHSCASPRCAWVATNRSMMATATCDAVTCCDVVCAAVSANRSIPQPNAIGNGQPWNGDEAIATKIMTPLRTTCPTSSLTKCTHPRGRFVINSVISVNACEFATFQANRTERHFCRRKPKHYRASHLSMAWRWLSVSLGGIHLVLRLS